MDRNEAIEIPFGAFNSELKGWEYTIPKGMEAEIKDGHFACSIPHLWEYNNKFEPIPLTAEILEKNGWYVPLLKSWWEHPDIAFWMKGYTDGTFELMIDEDSDISFCTIRYVHELQHALRLCGIDKTIEML